MKRLLLFLLVVAALLAGAYAWENANFNAPGPVARAGSETVVLIPTGIGVRRIAARLADAGVISNADLFALGVRLRGKVSALRAGEYAVPSRASMADIEDILVAGKSILHKLTAAEGLTSRMILDIVKADPVLEGEAGAVPDEGTLLPETYLFTRGTTRAELIARMRKAQQTLLDRLWPKRAPGLPFRDESEAMILASIVEKETAIAQERRHIAAVFVNRLRLGMKLQSDPTIIYGLTGGHPLGHGIRESELNRATPYNTSAIAGMPPTPICNPGADSIAAVLNPAASDDLYFVADGTGGHVFAATVAEHEKNVAKWRRIEHPDAPPPAPVHRHKLPKARHRR